MGYILFAGKEITKSHKRNMYIYGAKIEKYCYYNSREKENECQKNVRNIFKS